MCSILCVFIKKLSARKLQNDVPNKYRHNEIIIAKIGSDSFLQLVFQFVIGNCVSVDLIVIANLIVSVYWFSHLVLYPSWFRAIGPIVFVLEVQQLHIEKGACEWLTLFCLVFLFLVHLILSRFKNVLIRFSFIAFRILANSVNLFSHTVSILVQKRCACVCDLAIA